jgi:N-acetylglucosamine-6-sulfatase
LLRSWLAWLGLAVAMGVGLAMVHADHSFGQPQHNIVLILTDDEDVEIHASMRKTRVLLGERGTTFENFFVTSSLCCPSRASILRGQYPHNTQIMGNRPPSGGFETFRALGHEESTIATWLEAAGYHTAFFGKYLNGYRMVDGVPPGWNDWFAGGPFGYFGFAYNLNENGEVVRYGRRSQDFMTDVLSRKATEVIQRAAESRQPFFLYVAPFAPHGPASFAPRHENLFRRVRLPRRPAFNEPDVSDKPSFIRSLPPLARGHEWARPAWMSNHYRDRLRSLQSVDDMVATIVNTLGETGLLDETYIFYTSDNGFHMGEHRLPAFKGTAYEEDIRVPMVVLGPGVPVGKRVEAIGLNIDLAPTFAEIAGAEPPGFVDGRSLLPLLDDPDQPWRQSFLIEHGELGLQELLPGGSFEAVRTARWTYVEHRYGERELYDLDRDPYQLENLAEHADPSLVDELSLRLAELSGCAGSTCRALEDLPIVAAQPRRIAPATQ